MRLPLFSQAIIPYRTNIALSMLPVSIAAVQYRQEVGAEQKSFHMPFRL